MKIIIGLGNIGAKYTKTRHNCGFIVLDEIVNQLEKLGTKIEWKENPKLKAITTRFEFNGEKILLAKPTTLMNLSGESIRQIINFFKEPIENIIIIYDDLDLPLGTIRIREKGSAGTHNGMKSVIEQLGTEEIKRIRIGIESRGDLAPKQQDTSSYVLSNFTEKEIPYLKSSVEEAINELKSQIT